MPKSKVERATPLLDAEMRINLSALRVRLYLTTKDLRALDAAVSLAGQEALRHHPGTTASWRCEKEGAVLILLQQCIPFMQVQRELAEAVVEFLEADTANGMLTAYIKVLALRGPPRRGRRRGVGW